jgi:preprotein translocase SecE subunit
MLNSLINYLRGAFDELKKVVWPTKGEIVQHTLVVIGLSLCLALFLGAVDYLLSLGLAKLLLYR